MKVQADGVALPDVLAREGVHPETPLPPFTPAWDLVGVVDRLGDDVSGLEQREIAPVVAQRFPLTEARRAQELHEAGGVTGTFVLVLSSR